MNNTKCFKVKAGSKYDMAVKKSLELEKKFNDMYEKVSEILGENITKMARSKDYLVIDSSELTKEENKKLFKKDGYLKLNSKKGKEIDSKFKAAINELGLTNYEELPKINFIYSVMRRSQQQKLSSFVTSENDIYFKANFDLEEYAKGSVEPISEIEFEETYLNELKKREL